LRARREDIPLLLAHNLQKAGATLGDVAKQLMPEVEDYLCVFPWPGNVRQLENVCHWLTLMSPNARIHMADLPPELLDTKTCVELTQWQDALSQWAMLQLKAGKSDIAKDAQINFEKVLIRKAMELSDGHRHLAAKRLGYGRNTLTRKIKELQLFT
jgi:two-component system nitrogen regulation response regulator GlnG